MRLPFVVACAMAIFTLTACAKRPGAIAPANIPVSAYLNESCDALAQELIQEQKTLAALSKAQNSAATGDAVGVFLVAVPVGSLVGADKEGDIAVSKGKVNAIELAIKQKGC